MQIQEFRVEGLFGLYSHRIPFKTTPEDSNDAAVVIIHGYNGVGKTTVLKMIAGMLKLDFESFRAVPFESASLTLSSGDVLSVSSGPAKSLEVSFQSLSATLHPDQPGPLDDSHAEEVKELRAVFQESTRGINFEFLPDARSTRQAAPEMGADLLSEYERRLFLRKEALGRAPKQILADRVRDFVRNAQLDSPEFFRSGEPDLFQRIIDDLTVTTPEMVSAADIRERLNEVLELDQRQLRYGLRSDDWDYDRLVGLLDNEDVRALTVIATYSEFLLSRAQSRQFLADRIDTFEGVMANFLRDKRVSVNARHGLEIESRTGAKLQEQQLSSGEYQLLYLMVSALTTRRRGTVIAIDEPELSMHIEWQRKLVPSLVRCASRAAPQLLLATHSPDIATGYPESLIHIGGPTGDATNS